MKGVKTSHHFSTDWHGDSLKAALDVPILMLLPWLRAKHSAQAIHSLYFKNRCTQIVLVQHHWDPVKDGHRSYFSSTKTNKQTEPAQLSTCLGLIVLWTQISAIVLQPVKDKSPYQAFDPLIRAACSAEFTQCRYPPRPNARASPFSRSWNCPFLVYLQRYIELWMHLVRTWIRCWVRK